MTDRAKQERREQKRLEREQKRQELAEVKEIIVELAVKAAFMRRVALAGRNFINVGAGEDVLKKMGWVPDPSDPESADWVEAPLKHHLTAAVRFPGWYTHAVFTFSLDLLRDPQGKLKRVRHLSVTMSVPTVTNTMELRLIKDQYIQETFPPELLSLWFPDAEGVLTVIRAGQVAEDEGGTFWTPVVTHFYIDHDAPNAKPSLVLGPDGNPIVH